MDGRGSTDAFLLFLAVAAAAPAALPVSLIAQYQTLVREECLRSMYVRTVKLHKLPESRFHSRGKWAAVRFVKLALSLLLKVAWPVWGPIFAMDRQQQQQQELSGKAEEGNKEAIKPVSPFLKVALESTFFAANLYTTAFVLVGWHAVGLLSLKDSYS